MVIQGEAPKDVVGIALNGTPIPATFTENNVFTIKVPIERGASDLRLTGLDGTGHFVAGAVDSIVVSREQGVVITSVTRNPVQNSRMVLLTVCGSGFLSDSTPNVALTQAVQTPGFDANYVESPAYMEDLDTAALVFENSSLWAGEPSPTIYKWINLSNLEGQGKFRSNEQTFASPYDVGNHSIVVRFTGQVYASSPGIRYFGVCGREGFSLRVDDQLVGKFYHSIGSTTTDVTGSTWNGRALNGQEADGDMTFHFPEAGYYALTLDVLCNSSKKELEFFQTSANGGSRRLINLNSELEVFREEKTRMNTVNVRVINDNTLTCQLDTTDVQPGIWNVTITTACGGITLNNAVEVVSP